MSLLKSLNPKKILIGLLILIGLPVLYLWGAKQYSQQRTLTFVIPPGTGELLAQGEDANNFPDEIVLTVGKLDTLVIENQDSVVHSFGPFTILPNTTISKRFVEPGVFETACTFHPTHQTRLVVNPASWDIALRFVFLGVALALGIFAFWSIRQRQHVTKVTCL